MLTKPKSPSLVFSALCNITKRNKTEEQEKHLHKNKGLKNNYYRYRLNGLTFDQGRSKREIQKHFLKNEKLELRRVPNENSVIYFAVH